MIYDLQVLVGGRKEPIERMAMPPMAHVSQTDTKRVQAYNKLEGEWRDSMTPELYNAFVDYQWKEDDYVSQHMHDALHLLTNMFCDCAKEVWGPSDQGTGKRARVNRAIGLGLKLVLLVSRALSAMRMLISCVPLFYVKQKALERWLQFANHKLAPLCIRVHLLHYKRQY